MYKLIRFYNQNRKAIILILLIIAFFLVFIRTANYYASEQNRTYTQKEKKYDNLSNTISSNKSAFNGSEAYSKKFTDNTKIIDDFLDYCKKNDITRAYDLLSYDCKEQLFRTMEELKEKYINKHFAEKDVIYNIENYYDNIYKINFKENILATGKISNYSNQEFIAVIKENDELKLNINGLISSQNVKKEKRDNEIKIVISKYYQYMDFTIVSLEITNNNSNLIELDNFEDIDGIYLEDTNGSKYYLYTHEYLNEDFRIPSGKTKKINLKFYSKYISSKDLKSIVFNNIILKADDVRNKGKIQINLDIGM